MNVDIKKITDLAIIKTPCHKQQAGVLQQSAVGEEHML